MAVDLPTIGTASSSQADADVVTRPASVRYVELQSDTPLSLSGYSLVFIAENQIEVRSHQYIMMIIQRGKLLLSLIILQAVVDLEDQMISEMADDGSFYLLVGSHRLA